MFKKILIDFTEMNDSRHGDFEMFLILFAEVK